MNFFGGQFFGGGFFGATGGGARPDDGPRKGRKKLGLPRRNIYKPTGLEEVKARPSVNERADEAARIQAEVAAKLALDFADESAKLRTREPAQAVADLTPVSLLSIQEIEAEIGVLLRKKLRTEEDEVMLLLLMAAASVI